MRGQDPASFAEQTITRQTLSTPAPYKFRKSKPHPTNARPDEKPRGTQFEIASSPSTATSFLCAAFTSYGAWLLRLFLRRPDISSDKPDVMSPPTKAQKLKLQTLMDRRNAEARRADYDRNVIVTFPGESRTTGYGEKRKRDDLSEDEDDPEPVCLSSIFPLGDENCIERMAWEQPYLLFSSCTPRSSSTSTAPSPWERGRPWSAILDDDSTSMPSPDELEVSQMCDPGELDETDIDLA
ncbi:hypothetical protein DFH09DRAFT_301422 [Mycena vulgaris]|nr:hypothetical protein DFH09DRAFT_301422 [Mycena vulgaris]